MFPINPPIGHLRAGVNLISDYLTEILIAGGLMTTVVVLTVILLTKIIKKTR